MKRTLLAILALCACFAVTGCVVVDEPRHNKHSRGRVERKHEPGKGAPKAPAPRVEPAKPGKMQPAKPGNMNPANPGKKEPGRNF